MIVGLVVEKFAIVDGSCSTAISFVKMASQIYSTFVLIILDINKPIWGENRRAFPAAFNFFELHIHLKNNPVN